MKKEEIYPGKVIEMKEEHKELIKSHFDSSSRMAFAIKKQMAMWTADYEAIWKTVGALYPKIKEWNCSHDSEKGTLTVLHKKDTK